MLKVMVLEEGYRSEIYGGAIADGFNVDKVTVVHYCWSKVLGNINAHPLFLNYLKLENKFSFGISIWLLNFEILNLVKREKPDLVFIYRGVHIFPSTLKKIKSIGRAVIFGYNNDDPFSPLYSWHYWRHFKKGLKYYDHIFAYRAHNVSDFKVRGVSSVSLLRSYYLEKMCFPISSAENEYSCDVIFVGHYENDGRDQIFLQLLRSGVSFKIFGPEWHRSPYYHSLCSELGYEISSLDSYDYNRAINAAKIALVLLSKLNRDTYTRRCFEIPATKTMMLSEYTDDLASLFEQGKEIDFFGSQNELHGKIKYYLEGGRYKMIGNAAYRRLLKDGHEISDRCSEILRIYHSLSENTE